jgi:hypothetical protein
MTRHLCVTATLALLSMATPLRAANQPHVETGRQGPMVWTNDDLERLHAFGLICIVGRMNEETRDSATLPQSYVKTRDPEWYAEQATKLRDELEQRQNQLREYRLALDDARSLRDTRGGISFDDGDIGITPEAGIEILHQGVIEEQARLDELEDLARHHDMQPGTLRGQ